MLVGMNEQNEIIEIDDKLHNAHKLLCNMFNMIPVGFTWTRLIAT